MISTKNKKNSISAKRFRGSTNAARIVAVFSSLSLLLFYFSTIFFATKKRKKKDYVVEPKTHGY